MATRLDLIQWYLLRLGIEDLEEVGALAFMLLCARPRVWRWWRYKAYPLVIG